MRNDPKDEKVLLALEWPLGLIATLNLFALIIIGAFIAEERPEIATAMIATGFVTFIVIGAALLKIEQVTGFYKCRRCGHKQVPKYGIVFVAPHIGRTRYLCCPKCGKKSWQQKVL